MAPGIADLHWLFWAVGGLIAAAGLSLAAWALFRDRAKRGGVVRRRCPRCWYDMAGTPGLTCPECGHACREERRLYRTRRRWRAAAAGVVLALVGLAGTAFPAYQRDGWVAFIPSTVLIWMAPAEVANAAAAVAVSPLGFGAIGVPLPPVRPSASEQMCRRIWERLLAGRLWHWQAQFYLDRVSRSYGVEGALDVMHLDRWPVGEPLRVRVTPNAAFQLVAASCSAEFWLQGQPRHRVSVEPAGSDLDLLPLPGGPGPFTLRYRFLARGTTVYSGSIALAITPVPDRASMMTSVHDARLSERVRAALDPELAEEGGTTLLIVNDRVNAPPWMHIDGIVAFDAEVLVDSVVVGRASGSVETLRPVWKNWQDLAIAWEPGGPDRVRAGAEPLIRITGNAESAAGMLLKDPWRMPTECWTGSFTVPARWGASSRPSPRKIEDTPGRSPEPG